MRHDHTKWLVHFVRDRNPEQDFPGEDEEDVGSYAGGELECDAGAFSVLKNIIRLGGLLPGYSFRNGRTTIYGGRPAVCATEMPLYSFADYARQRSNPSKVSAYGIAFLKSEFFLAGGRPAIYGLSTDNISYIVNAATSRILSEAVMPLAEQYRFVAYNPVPENWIDWSHEREWRWIARDENKDQVWVRDQYGCIGPVPALPLLKGRLDGGAFSMLCFIVWTNEEAEELQKILTGYYLAGVNNYDTEFDKQLIVKSKIIVLADVIEAVEGDKRINSQTIEGLQDAQLLRPIAVHEFSKETEELIKLALKRASDAGMTASKEYVGKYPSDVGACGFADAICYEVASPIIQQLISGGNASGPFDGKVIIEVPPSWPIRQSVDYQEFVMRAVVESLKKTLEIDIFVESRLD
ncbi:MAG: hypothetical protein EKK53_04180 [Burkholderiales bacterium]|nr:MAG: hypothetical protein EKK53_04180 [Burkholderiales bacterium]